MNSKPNAITRTLSQKGLIGPNRAPSNKNLIRQDSITRQSSFTSNPKKAESSQGICSICCCGGSKKNNNNSMDYAATNQNGTNNQIPNPDTPQNPGHNQTPQHAGPRNSTTIIIHNHADSQEVDVIRNPPDKEFDSIYPNPISNLRISPSDIPRQLSVMRM
jgi:hypothetical protein